MRASIHIEILRIHKTKDQLLSIVLTTSKTLLLNFPSLTAHPPPPPYQRYTFFNWAAIIKDTSPLNGLTSRTKFSYHDIV